VANLGIGTLALTQQRRPGQFRPGRHKLNSSNLCDQTQRKGRRPTKLRSGHQSQNCETARTRTFAALAGARREGDRI